MDNSVQKFLIGGVILALFLSGLGLVVGNNQPDQTTINKIVRQVALGGVTNFDALTLDDGALTITSGALNMTSGNLTISSGTFSVSSTATLNGLVRYSPGNTPTTTETGTTAAILTEADFLKGDYHSVTLGGAVDVDFTYTFPASSTLSTLLPNVGDTTGPHWFHNAASSTSDHLLLFASGASGIDFRLATTTDDNLSVPIPIGAEEGFEIGFTLIAQPQDDDTAQVGDITVLVEMFSEFD